MNFNAKLRLPRLVRPSEEMGIWRGWGVRGAVGGGGGLGDHGTHPGLEVEPLGACVGPVPGAQRDLHLPQEEVPAQAVVVPHREVQGPALQVPLLQFILVGGTQDEFIHPYLSIPPQTRRFPPKTTSKRA